MHELSLTQSLVEIAEEHARRAGGTVIRGITLEVGELSGAVPEALEFAFDVCSRGTLAEGATLTIRRVPGHGRCAVCAAETVCHELTAVCPVCGALGFELDTGTELRVLELEVD
ncbi:MAG: hydrogenase maturation nickel metallochaperone HypA [Desulfuromonadales bacterium]|nr:hydrogenase maturation nickel metallochaperone HypA [Desulfuromonadales bacterium]